ncbi:hypothetical protein [Mycetocola reblochoni]|uniref:Uncharacterized protein n=2 Tax=Mycetocola reblochoni TaxID=331618 RepID=A0A1R4K370_9MICO|nr:hypothetical protein [Mycetocola reblochoni]RLP67687.1 hypothetical protein D9V30_13145 [Mycetocola reblochoni]SJN38525.1 hypothetical protein FM119_10975 [Mycetocola reblochoni REB411]
MTEYSVTYNPTTVEDARGWCLKIIGIAVGISVLFSAVTLFFIASGRPSVYLTIATGVMWLITLLGVLPVYLSMRKKLAATLASAQPLIRVDGTGIAYGVVPFTPWSGIESVLWTDRREAQRRTIERTFFLFRGMKRLSARATGEGLVVAVAYRDGAAAHAAVAEDKRWALRRWGASFDAAQPCDLPLYLDSALTHEQIAGFRSALESFAPAGVPIHDFSNVKDLTVHLAAEFERTDPRRRRTAQPG